jgi:hypothetical protein
MRAIAIIRVKTAFVYRSIMSSSPRLAKEIFARTCKSKPIARKNRHFLCYRRPVGLDADFGRGEQPARCVFHVGLAKPVLFGLFFFDKCRCGIRAEVYRSHCVLPVQTVAVMQGTPHRQTARAPASQGWKHHAQAEISRVGSGARLSRWSGRTGSF